MFGILMSPARQRFISKLLYFIRFINYNFIKV